MSSETQAYFKRFGYWEKRLHKAPSPNLRMVVVIPCFDEPDPVSTLSSLWKCERPACGVEVIVVLNSSENAPTEVLQRNRATAESAEYWIAQHQHASIEYHLWDCTGLPARHAGVGLARKIGMDEAVRRLSDVCAFRDGVIVCLDADCQCAPNYLANIESHFHQHPNTPGCSIYFEHPLSGPCSSDVYNAAANYELHLRYYVEALRYAGFPHAYHTVGSSMAVRGPAYVAQGGMNKRQAGEDFYFLHKIIPLGGFTELNTTTVFPSPRPSNRVPFGTGRAIQEALAGKPFFTYPIEAFQDLKGFLSNVSELAKNATTLPESLRAFLATQNFPAVVDEIARNTANDAAYRKRFFRWFDGFMAMKFVHHARDKYYGQRDVCDQAQRLLKLRNVPAAEKSASAFELLEIYRVIQRGGWVR